MEGFKTLPKMAHFKTGGHAKKEMCSGGAAYKKGGEVEDMAQDKKLIKKAFKQHDEAEHDKAPTEIKLRKGGRAKKELGSARKFIKAADAPSGAKKEPNKYKTGGAVGVYGAKKKSGDLDSIEKAKDIKPKKAEAPSGAKGPDAYKCGGKIKKMNDGRLVGALAGAASPAAGLAGLMAKREMEKKARAAKYLGASQQAELAQQQAAATAAQPQAQQAAPAPSPAAPPQDQMGNPTGMPAQKRGGKVKKYDEGGEIIAKVHEAIRSGKDLDPGIIREPTKPYVDRDPGMGRDLKGTLNIPGIGEVKQAPPKLTPNGRGMLLKTGGKVKRGNKK